MTAKAILPYLQKMYEITNPRKAMSQLSKLKYVERKHSS